MVTKRLLTKMFYHLCIICLDSLLNVRQSLVTAKASSLPGTNELCNSLLSTLKNSVDKSTNQLKVCLNLLVCLYIIMSMVVAIGSGKAGR